MSKKVLAIIYKEEDEKKKFLMLHRKLRWSGWECVKETIEEEETEEGALRRGIREEIGVNDIQVKKSVPISIPLADGSTIERVFLIKIPSEEEIDITKNKSEEHDGYKWVSQAEAEKILTYKNIAAALKEITTDVT